MRIRLASGGEYTSSDLGKVCVWTLFLVDGARFDHPSGERHLCIEMHVECGECGGTGRCEEFAGFSPDGDMLSTGGQCEACEGRGDYVLEKSAPCVHACCGDSSESLASELNEAGITLGEKTHEPLFDVARAAIRRLSAAVHGGHEDAKEVA